MKMSILRSLSVAILSVSASLAAALTLYSHDCYENEINVNCNSNQENNYNTCINCTVATVTCDNNKGKDYSDATDVYRYESTQIGMGTIRKVNGGSSVDKKCWDEYQCTNTVITNKECWASGCSAKKVDGSPATGLFCNKCGWGALIPNNGHYYVFPTEGCGS